MAYSPLGKGVLTGKYTAEELPPVNDYRHQRNHFREKLDGNLQLAERLRELAGEFQTTPVALALAWTIRQPGISVAIPGAKTPGQIRGHADALQLLERKEVIEAINGILSA